MKASCERCGAGGRLYREDSTPGTRWVCGGCADEAHLEYARRNPGWSPALDDEIRRRSRSAAAAPAAPALPCGCRPMPAGLLTECRSCHSSCGRTPRATAFCLLGLSPEEQEEVLPTVEQAARRAPDEAALA